MSTNTQAAHWIYTIEEWNSYKHQKYLDIIFKDNDIKVIYDIGANVGGTARIFLDYAEKNNKIIKKLYCFEPDKENMSFLEEKHEKEILTKKIETINKGIYYGLKEARVFGIGSRLENKIHKNVGGYSIEECMKEIVKNRNNNGADTFCGHIDNKVFSLDTLENLSSNFWKPYFIKIDVEGTEKNILFNSKLIKESKYLIVEWNQKECFHKFVEKNLKDFEIISCECDFLLKRLNV